MAKTEPTVELARLADRIFISAVVGQVFLILVIFLLGLSLYAWSVDRDAEQKIEAQVQEKISDVTEAVYVNSKTSSFALEELPVLRDLESALRLNGVQARARVQKCESSKAGEKEYSLRIGEFSLNECLYIQRQSSFAMKGVLFGFSLALVSLLLAVLGWFFWRGRFKTKILSPIVEAVEKEARDAAVGKMASQIAHDIRSPLAALNIFMKDLGSLPEEKRVLLRSAVNRIQDIANNILPANRNRMIAVQGGLATTTGASASPAQELRVELITNLVEQIVSEKRLQYREHRDLELITRFDESSYGAFSSVNSSEFQRVLSNLINNAVEALKDGRGRVVVLVENRKESDRVRISIVDNGRGIPEEVLPKLMVKGASFDKPGGSGLGLAHARQSVESWGGELLIESKVNFGTKICISLPRANSPKWFLDEIRLSLTKSVVVMDDDPSIHQIWLGRLQSSIGADRLPEILRFSSPEEADRYFSQHGHEHCELFLVDYEFIGSKENGLAWILRNQLMQKSVLVTSRAEEAPIRGLCDRMNLKLLPKNLSPYIPIRSIHDTVLERREDTWAKAIS